MEFSCLKGAKLASTWYGHLNGYDDTMTVLATYGDNINLMPAFDWTLNSFPLAAPASSSGWFLPSTGPALGYDCQFSADTMWLLS